MSVDSIGGEEPRALSLEEVAEVVEGRLTGSAEVRVRAVAPLETAGPDELGFLADRRYRDRIPGTRAGALLVAEPLADSLSPDGPPAVVVADAHLALMKLLERLFPASRPDPEIHPTAVVAADAEVAEDAHVGPYAVVESGARVGAGSVVGSHAVVRTGVVVGEGCTIHPHVVLYPGTRLGNRVEVHSGARLGVDGFGYVHHEGAHRKIPQVGRCVVDDDVEIGANTCIDRGSIGETRVGQGTKIDNLVHLGHNVQVGRQAFVVAQVGVAGSTRIGDGAMLGGQAGLNGHIEIGPRARIGAQAGVISDVGEGETVSGYPARSHREYLKGMSHVFRLPDVVRRLGALEKAVEASLSQPDRDPERSSRP